MEEKHLNGKNDAQLSEFIINSLPGVFYLYDEHGHFLRWNKNFETVTGYSTEEVAAMHPLHFFDSDEQSLLVSKIANVFASGSDSVEAHLLTKDKRRIPYFFTGNLLQYEGKSCLVGTGIDMTEQKKVEAKLAEKITESEERAKELNCLYRISELLSHSDLPEADMLQQCTSFIAAGYLHPDNTSARIILDEKSYSAPGFRETTWKQQAEILCSYGPVGTVEVFIHTLPQNMPAFLPEEQSLLDSIADILGSYIDRKRAEARQAFERRNKEALINSSDDLIWSIDDRLQLIAANQPFLDIILKNTGIHLSPGDDILLGGTLPGEFTRPWERSYRRALAGEAFRETIYSPANGGAEESWIETSFNPILEGSKVIGAACFARNITERKQFESRLLDMNQKLETAQAIAHLGYWELNLETNILYWSNEVYKIWGVTPDTFVVNFDNFYNSIHPDDRPEFDRQQALSLAGQHELDFVHRILLPGGSIKYVNEKGNLVYNSQGIPIRFEGTVQDVTERIQREAAIQESEEKYRYLFNHNPSVIFIWDLQDFSIQEVNTTALNTYGYTREEVMQMTIFQLRPEEDWPLIREFAQHFLTTGNKSVRRTWRHLRKNNEVLHMDITSHHIDYNGRPSILSLAKDITEQVKAEHEIARSEQRFRDTLDKMLEGVQIIGHDWRYLYLNEAAARHGRYVVNDLLGRTMMECFPGIQKSDTFSLLEHCMTKRVSRQHVENQFIYPDGTFAWFELSIQPVPEGIFILSMDITERKEAQEAIVRSEKRFRSTLDKMLEGVQIYDRDWNCLYVNDAVTKQGPYSKAEIYAKPMPENYPGIEKTEIFRIFNECMERNESRHIEHEFTFPDGTSKWFELSLQPIPEGLFILSIDISERKKSEQEIRNSEEKRELIMNAALDAIICIDTAGYVTFWNPQAEKIFGWKADAVMGKELTGIIIPDQYKNRHNEGMKRYLSTGQSQMLRRVNEFSGLRADGSEFPIELIVMPVQQGNEHFFCAFVRDITERVNARLELQERNEQLRNLSAYLQTVREEERTHIAREIHDELGQQLTVLKMDVASLRNKLKDPAPEIRQKTDDIVDIADISIQTIRRIITELRPGILDDLGLLAALEWQAREFEQKTGIRCRFSTPMREDHFSPAINTAVFRIFQESLTNVARHAGASDVDARLDHRDAQLVLEIHDNGRGISEDRKNNNTSFGLLGMRERAKMHNGTFDIFAPPEGGTTIILKIPYSL